MFDFWGSVPRSVAAEQRRRVGRSCATPRSTITLSDHGLILTSALERLNCWCTPVNALTFASTGGDGVQFSLVDLGDGPTEDSPVVMTVPMAFGDDLEPNWIVGATVREFLALGIDFGFSSLEQLAYENDVPSQIDAAPTQTRAPILQKLAEEFDLKSWPDLGERLRELSRRFGPALRVRALDGE